MVSCSRPRPLPYGGRTVRPCAIGSREETAEGAYLIYAKGCSWLLCGVVPSGQHFSPAATCGMPVAGNSGCLGSGQDGN